MSAETVELHFYKHLYGYENNLLQLVDTQDSIEQIIVHHAQHIRNCANHSACDAAKYQAILNNAGQIWNHNKFFDILRTPTEQINTNNQLIQTLSTQFGSIEEFENQFITRGMKQFGSGWVWLVAKNSKFEILTTPNGDNPLMTGYSPKEILIGIDLWEHAYYLDYRNRRAEYLKEIMKIVDWDKISSLDRLN